MSNNLPTLFTNIANAIRTKNGASSTNYYPNQMADAILAIPTGSTINNQNKTVNPSTSQQSVTADSGYTGLGTVTVTAMPAMTLPTVASSTSSGTSKATISRSTSAQYINIPTGYNSAAAYYTISATPNGTAGTPTASKGTVSNNSISITPSVTNTTGYITGSTKTGTAVTVSASELVSGTLSITTNGTKDVTNYASVNVNVSGGSTVNNQDKTVTPSDSQQSVTFDSAQGYTGLGTVTVNAIPQGEYDIDIVQAEFYTEDNTRKWRARANMDVWDGWLSADSYYGPYLVRNAVASNTTITPTESTQTIGGANYVMEGAVTVGAISTTYVGSGITQRSSTDLTVSGGTITAPAGYYASSASKSVSSMTLPTSAASSATSDYTSKATISRSTSAQYINIPPGYNSAGAYYTISATPNGSVTAPSTISGTSATVSTGTNTLTLTKAVSVTPNVTTAGYISAGTAGNSSVSLTASITTKAAATYHPSTSAQTISASQYLTGAQTIAAVTTTNLSASNILSGVTIKVGDSSDDDCVASVTGNVSFATYYTGSSAPSSSLGVNGDIYLQS